MGRHITENSRTISAVSSFQRQKKGRVNIGDESQHVPCQNCKKLFYPFNEKGNRNKKPFRYCLSCWRQSKKVNAVQIQADHSDFMQQDTQIMSLHASKRIMLNNIIFSKNSLRKAKAKTDHPRASVKIAKHGTNKFAWVSALADTGAQSNLWGWKNFQEAGFCKKDLMPVSITIRAANKIPVNIQEAFKATFSGMSPK